jgi:YVTN family beta-propeller protein
MITMGGMKCGAVLASAATLTTLSCVPGGNRLQAAENPAPVLAVLCKTESVLALVDPVTQQVQARIPTGPDPHEVAVSADGRTAVVANYGEQQPGRTLSVIDLIARKETRRVDLGALRRPHGIVERGGKFYFTAETNSAVARYDPAADRVDWLIGTGEVGTHMLALTPDGEKIYTANIGSNSVSAIDLTHPQGPLPKRISVGKAPEGLAVSPDGREVWVGQGGGGISVISAATDEVIAKIDTPDACLRLLFTLDGKRVLAPDMHSGELVVYDAETRKELKRIEIGKAPAALTLNGSGTVVFVSAIADHRVAVVDLDKLTVTSNISPGNHPDGIVWAGPRTHSPAAVRRKGSLGVALAPLDEEVRALLKVVGGAEVQMVTPGSAAFDAGLLEGDVILTVNGVRVEGPNDVVAAVAKADAGDMLAMEIRRANKALKVTATLKPRSS